MRSPFTKVILDSSDPKYEENIVTYRIIILRMLVMLLGVSTAPAQVMNIHTEEGVTSFQYC